MKVTRGRSSMGPGLSGSLPCGQKLHERMEEAGPCPDRRWKTTHSSFSKSRRPPWLHRRVKAPRRSEREGASPRSRWCHLPVGRFTRIHLGWETPTRDVHVHMGGPWDLPNVGSEPGKPEWLVKGNWEEMSHKTDANHHEGVTHSLSWACVSIHMYCFFLLINTCFTTFGLCGNSFSANPRDQGLAWPLV